MDASHSARRTSAAYPHAVKFYRDEASLGRTVADFLTPGLRNREPAIVIATPEHRTLIAAELRERGLNIARLERDGDLQVVDADAVMARFMVGKEPDAVAFHATIDDLIARACKDRQPCPVRAYGEIVDVLWKRANAEGAIRVEMLWNQVATKAQFSLLCGYAVGNFYKELSTGPSVQQVCDLHDHIISEDAPA